MSEHKKEERPRGTLAARLSERIRLEGAVSFREWMAAALYDEREGYYQRPGMTRWGREGDYRTSPERSRLFAATFARYFAGLYHQLGSPDVWTIAEAGAGSGHFAAGVLGALQRWHPEVFKATRYLIDETSRDARASATWRLESFAGRVTYRRLDDSDTRLETGLIFSNELLDALPVHRVIGRGEGLRELCVCLNEAGEFVWCEREPTTPRLAAYLSEQRVRLLEGQVAEVNLAATDWLTRMARKLEKGFLIAVDYGAEATELYDAGLRPKGSLRAFRRHRFVSDVLEGPGEQDITTTVDWTALRRAGERCGLETLSFARQDKFLLEAGLLEQLDAMTAETESEAERVMLRTSAREMILPGGMSQSFQVLVQQSLAEG